MVDFFKQIFNELSENGMAIAMITAFNALVTLIISKTIMLNQEQSFWILLVIFLGLSLLSIVVSMMFKRSTNGNKTIVKNVKNKSEVKINSKTSGNDTKVEEIDNSKIDIKN